MFERLLSTAPWLMAAGLASVVATLLGGVSAAQTGVALIAVGACAELASRRLGLALVAASAVLYAGLYLLFVGAAWHGIESADRFAVGCDLMVSVLVMALHAPLLRGSVLEDLQA